MTLDAGASGPVDLAAMQAAVLEWYAGNARDLAFRRTTDPWSVLVSEVIAQQTQASRAAGAWSRFIAEFPTPAALAEVSPATVIRAWRGLGYNRRAIALRKAAIAIVEDHRGRVPDTLDQLMGLPGVGPYTARAVLAIAFNQPAAALDTNIRRVVGRAFLGSEAPLTPRAFQAAADGFVPAGRAGQWTHALMDIGAAICRKRDPRCDACPLAGSCPFLAAGRPSTAARAAKRARPFRSTTRWLRGRILDRLRDASDGSWISFDGPLGEHSLEVVVAELARMQVDALLEMRSRRAGAQARLATA